MAHDEVRSSKLSCDLKFSMDFMVTYLISASNQSLKFVANWEMR